MYMYSPLYIQSSFDFYELIFIEAVKLQQTPAKVPRELSKNCVWRNDNTTQQNSTEQNRLERSKWRTNFTRLSAPMLSVPNVMPPNQGGGGRAEGWEGVHCVRHWKSEWKWKWNWRTAADAFASAATKHFQARSSLIGFSFAVFHRIKITIIYISGIDASMTYSNSHSNYNSIEGVWSSRRFVNISDWCACNYARHCGWTGLPMDLFTRTHVIDNYRSGVIKRSQGDSVEKLLG